MGDKVKTLIELLDEESQDKLIRLQQKLKGLQAELEVKLQYFSSSDEEAGFKEQNLQELQEEVQTAIANIEQIMATEISEDDEMQFIKEEAKSEIDSLASAMDANIDYISTVKERL